MPAYRYKNGDRPLDGYTIEYALGRGGFGEVYFAKSDAGREVALKAVQNFEEIELRGIGHCMNLKSPHLVMIFDVRKGDDGIPWVIMEYVSGPSLREILDQSPGGIGVEQSVWFMRELCKGMAYLHDAGVVHRDLKPHNVFFEDGNVKIGDYSLSKAITNTHLSGHTSTVGSVHYMAPEISMGRYDKTVDVYALGVMMYEMLTGAPPYVGESMGEVLMKHLSASPDVSQIAEPFASVINKAMQREPSNRFASVSEMMQALSIDDASQYSLPPTSLSMIGQRASQQRKKRVEAKHPQPGLNLSDTFATPIGMRETREQTDSMPFERPVRPDMSSVGLWYRRKFIGPLQSDPVSIYIRLPIAWLACAFLVTIGCVAEDGNWFEGDIFLLSLGHTAFWAVMTWVMLSVFPRSDRKRWAVGTRILSMIPMFAVTLALATNHEIDEYIQVVGSMAFAMFIMDWRCYLAASRYPRVGLIRTLIMGGLAMTIGSIDDGENRFVMCGAMAMAAALVVQLVAPMGRSSPVPSTGSAEPDEDSSIVVAAFADSRPQEVLVDEVTL